MRSCGNCKRRAYSSMFGIDYCLDYEMATTESEEIEAAKDCSVYEEGDPDCFSYADHYSSSTAGDYSPGNPWDAPGMSVKDFI